MGKLIAIDGLDGSGKGTQTQKLYQYLTERGIPARLISFPNYQSEAAALVKLYLNGGFGENPADVNPYAASTFYAVDRFASFQTDWSKDYHGDTVILCDRYATSNLFHQMTKLPQEDWDAFIAWLEDFEYNRLGIPAPDLVLYFDMDPAVSRRLISSRYEGEEQKRDIHEKNFNYLLSCRDAALYAAEKCGWVVIQCSADGEPLPIEEIGDQVLAQVLPLLQNSAAKED